MSADTHKQFGALMFTDLVGSVALQQRLGTAAYMQYVARHDEIIQECLGAVRGARVLNETGDGFLVRFDDPSDAVSTALLLVESKAWFWALGLVLGAFFGPVQSASRSLLARLAPASHQTQMFGLFALSGRITAFVGPAVLAWATAAASSQRAGMATILAFFGVGLGLLLWKVPERVSAGSGEAP